MCFQTADTSNTKPQLHTGRQLRDIRFCGHRKWEDARMRRRDGTHSGWKRNGS
ncbi:hypothetical protein FTUN_2188 [Frigoriglobus tundricola]|uniref:Uncharacterized protein n=1 Tax=Frigoriglobus tundricola TaxID=2774151 RepID=A0A6M5YMU0_9BACT|nr:hypothetical protein FTUN_2188 [Frigoriglobus tundricola]